MNKVNYYNLVFWNYNYLHNNVSTFTIKNFTNLSLTFSELLQINHNNIINDSLTIIKIMKVYKHNPKYIIDIENPYWNENTKIIDYIDFYNIKSTNCDIIFKLIR